MCGLEMLDERNRDTNEIERHRILILDHPRTSAVGLFLTFSHRGSVSNASVLIKVALKTGNASCFSSFSVKVVTLLL